MIRNFVKRNWVYIVLVSGIILVNVAGRAPKEEVLPTSTKEVAAAEKPTLFVEFEEAQERSRKIEEALKGNAPLYLFYISANLFIIAIFLLGLLIDGFFISRRFKKIDIFARFVKPDPPPWTLADSAKIVILGFSLAYFFFILLALAGSAMSFFFKVKFTLMKNDNFRMIFDTIVLDFFVLTAVLAFLWRVHRKKIVSLGLGAKNALKNVFYGACGYLAILPVILLVGVIAYIVLNMLKLKPPPQPIVELFLVEKNIAFIFVASLIASIFGPVIEEIFFRGVLYNALKRKVGIFGGIMITSVLFSFLHTHAMTYFLVGFIPITILGVVLAYLYERTGSLVPSITLHVLNNLGGVIMVFLFKYFNSLAV
ncbi:MAG: CPBP family intramembrane metalloprotease [Candidatus Omnitrophica bacterium]|nr:CPBP family intramembrane metalloprotease [Candidatus Omnitrophota bacterium]